MTRFAPVLLLIGWAALAGCGSEPVAGPGPGAGTSGSAVDDDAPAEAPAADEAESTGAPPGGQARAGRSRLVPEVPAGELRSLAADNADFAFDLLRALGTDGNLFYSPHSISLALGMTYGGARADTAAAMAEVLRFERPEGQLHRGFNALDRSLTMRGSVRPEEEGARFELSVVNALWGQAGYTFLDDYLDLLAAHYGAGMRLLDFRGAAEASRAAINAWVSESTRERIPELVPPGMIGEDTRLILTNAIYFKASWLEPFRPENTEEGIFAAPGGDVTVPLMHGAIDTTFADGDGYDAVRLPYVGGKISMIAVLPDDGDLARLEGVLDGAMLGEITAGLRRASVAVTLPKWTFRSRLPLRETLSAMGMGVAFGNAADFSGMDGTRDLAIDDVVHEAFVSVDEEGTEAAAATAVGMRVTSLPMPATFEADRPFLFFILDEATRALLFVGRVTDPSQREES